MKANDTSPGLLTRQLPIPAVLIERMRALGETESGYVFRSRRGKSVNPGNALKRYVHPIVQSLGIQLHGWHDFRRTIATNLLRNGESAKLVAGILGNSVEILLNAYDLMKLRTSVLRWLKLQNSCYQLLPNRLWPLAEVIDSRELGGPGRI